MAGLFILSVGAVLGAVAMFFAKDKLTVAIKGASAVAADLRVKAAQLEATLTAVKAKL